MVVGQKDARSPCDSYVALAVLRHLQLTEVFEAGVQGDVAPPVGAVVFDDASDALA